MHKDLSGTHKETRYLPEIRFGRLRIRNFLVTSGLFLLLQTSLLAVIGCNMPDINSSVENSGQNRLAGTSGIVTTINDNAMGSGLNQFFFSPGWNVGSSAISGYYLNDEHYSNVQNSFYQVTFFGSQIQVYSTLHPSNGISAYSVDGGAEILVDQYAVQASSQNLVFNSGVLSPGIHTLKVRVTGTRNPLSAGTYGEADRVVVLADSEPNFFPVNDQTKGNQLNQFEFSNGWTSNLNAAGSLNNDEHYTNTNNAFYQVRFQGTQVQVYSSLHPSNGITAYSIDGGAEVLVDQYDPAIVRQKAVYTSPVLTYGEHILKVRITGTKNPKSTGTYCAADKVLVISNPENTNRPNAVITTPADDASFNAPATIILGATASFAEGEISKVEFFQGATLLGEGMLTDEGNYVLTWQGVAKGSYVITAKVTSDNGLSGVSSPVDILVYDEISEQIVNDQSMGSGLNQFEFSTGWTNNTNAPGFYLNNEHYGNTAGISYQVKFFGRQIYVFSSKNPANGISAYSIDGGPEVMIDQYGPQGSALNMVYHSGVLPLGAHTLRVRVTGNKNPLSSGTYGEADKVNIYNDTVIRDFPPPPIPAEPYYYLRITQNDGYRTITAPIWVLQNGGVSSTAGTKEIFNHYRGDLHNHTSYSDGTGTPADAYRNAIEGGADFLAVTDHTYTKQYTSSDYWSDSEWRQTLATARSFTTERFVAIPSWETAASGVKNQHLNVYGGGDDWYVLAFQYGLQSLYNIFINNSARGFTAMWNHPTETNSYDNFAYYSENADQCMGLIEWWNAQDAREFEDKYQLALSKGWHVAPVADADDHGGRWIKGYSHRTIIMARSLTLNDLLDAMRNGRVYASRDINIRVDYYINNTVMGSTLENPKSLRFDIVVADPDSGDNIRSIEIIGANGRVIDSKSFSSNSVVWNPEIKLSE
jgi:hypothetical protein